VDADAARARERARTIEALEKKYGRGAILRLGDRGESAVEIPVWSTGSFGLDLALGVGGLPRGRIVEIYGPEASGKTSLCLSTIASVQRGGGAAAVIDTEHALDPNWARTCGVDLDNLYIAQPQSAEEALNIADELVRSGGWDAIVIDSVAALAPMSELSGEIGESYVGLQARLMSQALRKLVGGIKQSGCLLVFTNQIREKIGVLFGNPETTPGGRALKFYASVRIEVRRIKDIKQGTLTVGTRVRSRVVKNKVAPPMRSAEFDILYSEGISRSGEVLDLGAELGVIHKAGAFYTYQQIRLGHGREASRDFLRAHEDVRAAIEREIREKVRDAQTPLGLLTNRVDVEDAEAASEDESAAGDAETG
jgi:recombination protein RecA